MDWQFEIVIYRLKADVDRDQFMEISDLATEWLRNRPGFLGRELLEDDSGQWVDLVRWATIEDALAAASAFMEGSPSSSIHGRRRAGKHNHAAPASRRHVRLTATPANVARQRNEEQSSGETRGEAKP